MEYLELKEDIKDSNERFIKNNILIFFTYSNIIIMYILKFEIINEIKYYFSNLYNFRDGNNENEILFHYYYKKK